MNGLQAVCALVRWGTGSAAVSVATVADDHLHYVAADGAGAEAIVGARLPAGRGIAGFAAATGQSLTVREPESDPRFARETALATGYLPSAIQCIPVEDRHGEVVAVLTLLDRSGTPSPPADALPLGRVTELVAELLSAQHGPSDDLQARLDRLPAADQARARTALLAVLDAIDR